MKKWFHSSVIFSGGGTRFALYGGMYDALKNAGKTPDLMIASCGGAMAAAVINAFSEGTEQKKYLQSEEFYHFIKNIQLTEHRKWSKLGFFALKKCLDFRNAPFIEDVFGTYLVELGQHLEQHFPSLGNLPFSAEKPTIIIGSKILFQPNECGKKRDDKTLYQKVFFTDENTSKYIDNQKIIWKNHPQSLAKEILIKTDFSLMDAVRISISDMFYVPPVFRSGAYYAGGAIDLVPLELALSLSEEITAEKKQKYKSVEEAFVRAVLGFSANERLKSLDNFSVKNWVDTRDVNEVLRGFYPQKFIDWKKQQIAMNLPKTYEDFKESVLRQWNYGYERTLQTITK